MNFLRRTLSSAGDTCLRRETPPGPRVPCADDREAVAGGRAAIVGGAGAASGDDGLVTALELASMDLWGTQLVVLSACESGRGALVSGEGVYGLRRAVLAAGAETLVASLWSVDDATTAALMDHFYRELLAGADRDQAMARAARRLRAEGRPPYYWAPFIVLGHTGPLTGVRGLR
jgi:hypothetical protein